MCEGSGTLHEVCVGLVGEILRLEGRKHNDLRLRFSVLNCLELKVSFILLRLMR